MFCNAFLFFNIVEETSEIDVETTEMQIEPMEQDPETLAQAIRQESALVAVKSEPLRSKSIKELATLGMGTFSIDEDTAKNMASGRFVKRIKIKRCGNCKACRRRNCRECIACKDMVKYGGEGQLKQACIRRRCANANENSEKKTKDQGNLILKKTSNGSLILLT